MRRIVVVSSLGVVLIPLLLASAAWLPGSAIERAKGSSVPTKTEQNVNKAAYQAVPVASGPQTRYVSATSQPTLAEVQWRPFPTEIPPGLGTVLAAACLLLPFALSMWGTLKKNI